MDNNAQGVPPPYQYAELYEDKNTNSVSNFQQPTAPPVVRETIMTSTTVNAAPPTMTVNGNPAVGPNSTTLTCPQCRCRINTNVRHRSTTKTHQACLMLSWTCCLCCIPYCMDSCRNANHFCPMCGAFIGTYQS